MFLLYCIYNYVKHGLKLTFSVLLIIYLIIILLWLQLQIGLPYNDEYNYGQHFR